VSGEGLRELLARLRQHLHSGDTQLDAEARQHLSTLTRDLERSLAASDAPAPESAASRLESLAVKFEVSHPALAETLREVIDALGKAGI
jgi:hypothetical protein